MFLKSIEVRGFKSFADKTELEFKKGVTAVIGPNGSGKSNISDAVRWVLGEQSVKSLRGAKMQDVIFAGTQFRKPVGVAQVSLLLDNEDKSLDIEYSQVKVTRRLYRSGDSEYLINNTKCRLKDIQELFMDTGIGKEGYSLIGQGKIEAILSGHTEDRRQLFEEAAGIVKFKTRKKEAERRLKNTDDNLVRINDVLSTYEGRIEPLRIDKEKAEEFLEYSEALKDKEVNVILHSHAENVKELGEVEQKFSLATEELEKANEIAEKSREEVQTWENVLETFEEEFAREKQKYYSKKNEIEKLNGDINLLNERINNAQGINERNQKELSSVSLKLEELKNQKREHEMELEGLLESSTSMKSNKEECEKRVDELSKRINLLNSMIIKTNEEINKVRDELYNKKNNFYAIEKELKSLNERKEELGQVIRNSGMSVKIKEKTKDELTIQTIEMDSKIQNLSFEIEECNKNINLKKREFQKNEGTIQAINRENNLVEAKKNALKNLNEHYEGYNKSVQKLMGEVHKIIPEYKSKCWVLGEILKVPKEFELALEITLGNAISNVITENETIAKRLIRMLKEKRLGRATFLPIDIIKGRRVNVNDNIRNMNGYLGIAADLVEFDSRFKNAIEYTLGRTVIADTMDNALAIGKRSGLSYRIVTLDGQVINPGGSMTGGSVFNKNNSIIGRKREVEELEKRNLELIDKMKGYNELKLKITSDIEKIDESILNKRDEVHEIQLEKAKVKTKVTSIIEEIKMISNEMNRTKVLMNTVLEKIVDAKDEFDGFDERNKGLESLLKLSESNVEKYMDEKLLLENEKEEKSQKLVEIRVQDAEVAQKVTGLNGDVKRIINEIQGLELKVAELAKEMEKNMFDKESSKDLVQENLEKVNEIKSYIENADQTFKENDEKRISIKNEIKKFSEAVKKEEEHLLVLNKNINKFEVLKAKIESDIESIFQRLNEDLNMTLAEAEEFRDPEMDIENASKDIKKIKAKISALGTVNLGAIEEYKEVSETYNFMNTQREDLITSKEELIKLIEEMTEKMRVLFRENFEIMRKNFNVTFKQLFKGGSADLLIGEGDELQAGIEINVQPPGKKLQNISLMSGGEKVLSAIALLFAILKMKPTPFCILDEIEAALDDANVFRFAEFVKKFSTNIQFIVITHRKGTMSMSDVIYGVTMEEKGISKILSINLNKESTLELQGN